MTTALRLLVGVIALLLGVQVVRNAAVTAMAGLSPAAAAKLWSDHPEVELSLGMTAIGAAAHRGKPVGPATFTMIDDAATKAPLASEPYLVRGVQAQIVGDTRLAEQAFQAAEWRDPRSLAARYFLADHYFRSGDVRRGLIEFAALARLTPNGVSSVTPYVATYARNRANWPQLRALFRAEPSLAETSLEALANDPANAEAILALADAAHRDPTKPWLSVLLQRLVDQGQYAKARSIWAEIAHVRSGPGQLLFDPDFANDVPPPPFNWDLTSSTVGLAERQPGGRLHVIYYGQEDGLLARQLLVLAPGSYRLGMQVAGGGPQSRSLRWSLTCARTPTPFATMGLDAIATREWIFTVPAGCAAQWLDLAGVSSDFPKTVDVAVGGLRLRRAQPNG